MTPSGKGSIDRITMLIAVILAAVVLIFSLPFKDGYIFDWDQANDYEAVETIAGGKLLLIGPRVTSDSGFFLGPWHYYFLLPFYLVTKGSLDMGFWAALTIQYLLVLVSFLVARKWFGLTAGVATGIMFASQGGLISWGFMYVPLVSLMFFWGCLVTLSKPKLLPVLFLFLGFICTTYTVLYALVIPFGYVVVSLIKARKVSWRDLGFGGILFWLPYSPLILFDLRHNFLNIRNVLGFAGSQQGSGAEPGYFFKVFLRSIEIMWLNRELSPIVAVAVTGLTLAVLVAGALILFKKNKALVGWWLVSSLIPMAFYKGNVSEYYYSPVILLIPFFVSGLLAKSGVVGRGVLLILVVTLSGARFRQMISSPSGISLAAKVEVVREMEKIGSRYSVSYELPLGEDSGYNTIFRKLGKKYVKDGSAQLYTITYPDKVLENGEICGATGKLVIHKR